jgi:hypothetical protein
MEAEGRVPEQLFQIVMYKDAEQWVAHCLQLNIITTSDDMDEAYQETVEVCLDLFRYGLENDCLADIYHQAPGEIWAMLNSAQLMREYTEVIHYEKHKDDITSQAKERTRTAHLERIVAQAA